MAELQAAINESRLRVWARQPEAFFAKATIDFDGTYVATDGERREGVDINYKGEWSYHPLVASLANTREPLEIENRRGNRPSHEGAAEMADRTIALVRKAGFRSVLLRGDTAFSQSQHLDRWHEDGVEFIFGYAANTPLVMQAANLPNASWTPLKRKKRGSGSELQRSPSRESSQSHRRGARIQEPPARARRCRGDALPTKRVLSRVPDGGPEEDDRSATRAVGARARDGVLLLHHEP
ncbi:MAG: transposase [Planctomycetes bacterium]|nr:transposase [Planctomycetota bacterium]